MADANFTLCSRDKAKSLKLKRYFTGKPCHRGHIAERIVSSYECLACAKAKYHSLTKEQKLERSRKIRESRALKHGGKYYFTGKPCKRGHIVLRLVADSSCVECVRVRSREYYEANKGRIVECAAKWSRENKEKSQASKRRWRERNTEYMRKHRIKTREQNNERYYRWRALNPDRARLIIKKYKTANPALISANSAKRRACEIQRTPGWADKEGIRFFYECRPKGCHVDHIMPLQGKRISGLHVETNLQWLPARINESKSNKWPHSQ